MKLFSVVLFFFISSAQAEVPHLIRHLDLEMTGAEYRQILKSYEYKKIQREQENQQTSPQVFDAEEPVLDQFLIIGQKNLTWVDLVNSARTFENRISLSSAATQKGFPVSSPNTLNFTVIKESWSVLQSLLPPSLKRVIFDGAPITKEVPLTDREFVEWLWQVDRAYQMTARYKLLKPWKGYLAQVAESDVRGYLTLRDDSTADEKLNRWSSLSQSARARFTTALIMICRNSGTDVNTCESRLQQAISQNRVLNLKLTWMPSAERNYNNFFQIGGERSDVTWTAANPNVLEIPFANPHNDAVLNFLKFNIEDEFKWLDWRLKLNFIYTDDLRTTHIVFEPGSTPHVNELGGSEITMDANAPLTEYDVQWTIRHEYGHVLGLPDCYVEFYDEETDSFISYQLDVTNLMCSRRGHFQEHHFNELKRAYFR